MDDSKRLAILSGSCSDLMADFRARNDERDVEDDDEKVRIGVCWVV